MRDMYGEVSVHMEASPAEVWGLVSDVTRIGEFSPETFEAEWTGGATRPEPGATFRGHVKRNGVGPIYWAPCKVRVAEPEQHFEFQVMLGGPLNTWGYRLQPSGEGTDVTEYYRLTPSLPMKIYWTLLGKLRGKTNENGMRETLERMRAVVEA